MGSRSADVQDGRDPGTAQVTAGLPLPLSVTERRAASQALTSTCMAVWGIV